MVGHSLLGGSVSASQLILKALELLREALDMVEDDSVRVHLENAVAELENALNPPRENAVYRFIVVNQDEYTDALSQARQA
jgi:hypothetical protein